MIKTILKILLIFIVAVLLSLLIWGIVYLGTTYQKVAPKAKEIIDYHPKLTTKIFDRNGELIANLFEEENREYVPYSQIPGRMVEALLAIEDTNFFEHHGINVDAIVRAVIKDIKARRFVEGASTITQQLVKNMVLSRKKKIERKIQEILIALEVERYLTKEDILERYFNQVYFGHGYYGVATAARGYFHKSLKNLTLKEIAILVGLPRAPSYYDPTRNYEAALKRADRVLSRMHELGWIDDKEFFASLQERPKVYDDSLTRNRAPYIVDEVVRRLSSRFKDLKSGGYQIYTTIDLQYQELMKRGLQKGYRAILERGKGYNYKKLNGAAVVVKQKSGEILALVGGVDYTKSPFNRVTQGKRQPGSAFKPFIYLIALDLGYSPATKLPDVARTYKVVIGGKRRLWQPKNYERNFKGVVTLREALVHSRNLATINLVEDIGLSKVYDRLMSFGFTDLPRDLSLALGTMALSPIKLAEYYTIISNYGTKNRPILIKEVVDFTGKRIYGEPLTTFQVERPRQAYLMIDILKDVVKRGTGRRARVDGVEVAGKTGTTNNYKDAWFCGFTPDIEVIVWYGQDDNTPLKKGESGGRAAAPVVGQFIREIYRLHPELGRKFPKPKGIYWSYIGGKRELFTDISKPSREDLESEEREEELLF
ncbi:MAG: PBP1A family penicillin-binding protein [Epsilonproteobacteria bacterium]|nr:penicillin-binding protein [Campylobacterota bacterium]NPA56297.1 PBP1A family penicillin-binding protein [Campylobacterota bacterium]